MKSTEIFTLGLGLQSPWHVKTVEFKTGKDKVSELHIEIDFTTGARFKDETGTEMGVYDTVKRKWQHLNFFEHACVLSCRVPRIKTSSGDIKTVEVPWARVGSGFTLLFEALIMAMIEREMPLNKIAGLLRISPNRIWRMFNHWVSKARQMQQLTETSKLGIDETSVRKGHKYVTIAVDLEKASVIHVTPGKGKDAVKRVKAYLDDKSVSAEQIRQVSMDLSPSYIAGVGESFPKAQITFDRFHVVKLLNEAMDTVRKNERAQHDKIKGHKYTFLKNKQKLSSKKLHELEELITLYPTLGAAYRLKELFNDMWSMPTRKSAEDFLVLWCAEVEEAKIPAFLKFADTVRAHWSGIVSFIESRITNGILESINSKVQLAKRRARGYSNMRNFTNMIYFLCGKLGFSYPLYPA